MPRDFKFEINDEVTIIEGSCCGEDEAISKHRGQVLVVAEKHNQQTGMAMNYALKTKEGKLIMRTELPGRTHPFFCDELELY